MPEETRQLTPLEKQKHFEQEWEAHVWDLLNFHKNQFYWICPEFKQTFDRDPNQALLFLLKHL